MPVVKRYETAATYLAAIERDASRWVAVRSGSYDDLKDSGLLPRGL